MLHALGVRVLHLLQHLRVHARHHLEQALERSELFDLAHGGEEILQVHALLPDLPLHLLRFVGVERALRLLHQRDDIALLEDAAGHAVGMEVLERIGLFADTDVLDGLLEHAVDGQCGAAARVAVHLGEDHAGDVEPRVETLCDLHGILSRHAVGDEQDLIGLDGCFQPLQLGHHAVVDLQAARGIDEHDAIARAPGHVDARLRDLHHVRLVPLRIDRNVELFAERLELVDGRGTVHVAGDEAHLPAFELQLARELGGRRRLS